MKRQRGEEAREVAQRLLMKEIKEGRKECFPPVREGSKVGSRRPSRHVHLRPNVRKDPPECDKDWHEFIGKNVFTDL